MFIIKNLLFYIFLRQYFSHANTHQTEFLFCYPNYVFRILSHTLSVTKFLCFPFSLLPHPLSCLPSFCKRSFHFLFLVCAASDCAPLSPRMSSARPFFTLHSSFKWKKEPQSISALRLSKKAATYSPTLRCSTIGALGLNFSVRDGKRWNPEAKTTWVYR